MPVYIALLRGINLGPHKRMKMEKLRSCCEALGFEQVATYIQSGNLVFKGPKLAPAALSKKLEQRIAADFGFSADVFTRTSDELKKITHNNPLLKEAGVDPAKLHVVFLAEEPRAEAISKLESVTLAPDRVRISETEIYFYFPNGVSGSSVWKQNLDRILSVTGTMRNWNTVNKLSEMAERCE
ncbi:MAG TPA: DUF1697 domain-containing protein [Candidatus Acidoferrales bacterium]|nr:DUF1697 domain-containing protein [Candidatus Acidoferrales bacterium]